MELSFEKSGTVTIVKVIGNIDSNSANDFAKFMKDLIKQKNVNILVDMSETGYIDSIGLGIMVGTVATLKKKKGQMMLVNIPEAVERIFIMTKLNTILTIRDDFDSALKEIELSSDMI
jgi:anti-sigma B factor antagonist